MGYLGGVFGIALIAGPLAGGWITDSFSWRWLFYVNLPIGITALAFIVAFFHPPQVFRRRSVDYVGFITLGFGLCALLLATSWGGTQYPWGSWQIISLYVASAVILIGFVVNENYAVEPVVPLRLWKNSIFTLSNASNMAVAMAMYGAVFYIPLYAQGVIGISATNSGAVLIPVMLSAVVLSIFVGRLITRTGRYKGFVLAGLIAMGVGYYLLTRLGYGSTQTELTLTMIVLGVGLGAVLQTYILIVQNATSREDLGIVTSITQLTRSMGATFGTAIFGTLWSRMKTEIPKRLPPQALQGPQVAELSDGSGVGTILDPNTLGQLPDAVATGIREGLAAAMHPVFVAGLPIIAIAFVATLFIKELPLRTVAFADVESDAEGDATALGVAESNGKEALLRSGLTVFYLSRLVESRRWSSPELLRAASELVEPNGEVSVRERALRADEEVLKPVTRSLLSTYLLQRREFSPECDRVGEVRQHPAAADKRRG